MGKSNIKNIYPLTPMQEGLLFHALGDPPSTAYFEQISYRLDGPLDIGFFQEAWLELIRRHDILRSVFTHENADRPLQVVFKELPFQVQFEDISGLPADAAHKRIQEFKLQDRCKPFDLRSGPLMRIHLFKIGTAQHEVIWSHHHILMDGWSLGLLQSEFGEIYGALSSGRIPRLPPPVPFGAFVKWIEAQPRGRGEDYWKSLLQDYEYNAGIPSMKSGSKTAIPGKQELHRVMPVSLSDAITELGRELQVTPGTLLQCAWGMLLARYNQVGDVVFGSVVSGRSADVPGIERLVGICVNTIPVRIRPAPRMPFARLAKQVQDQSALGGAHHHLPLSRIQSLTIARQDLIRTHFAFENFPLSEGSAGGSGAEASPRLEVRGIAVFEQTHYDFDLQIHPGKQWRARIAFKPELHPEFQAEAVWIHFCRILECVTLNPEIPVGDIDFLSSDEKEQLLGFGRVRSTVEPSSDLIQTRFRRAALQHAKNIAVSFEGNRLTYGELDARSDSLAALLQANGVRPDSLVGVCLSRSLELPLAILAILKAGGAYVPLEPDLPVDRLNYLVQDSGASVFLTSKEHRSKLPGSARCICLDDPESGTGDAAVPLVEFSQSADNLAYVIYTSGSTGNPKGVQVTHRNVVRLLDETRHWFEFGAGDVWTLFHSYAFDFSVWELWGALLYGGRLVVVPYWTSRAPDVFRQLLGREKVSVLNQTPSAFKQLIQADESVVDAEPLSLRYVIFGGEALEPQSLRPWFARHGDQQPRLVNMYGITETTVHVTYRPLSVADLDGNASLIGCPIPDLSLTILDSQNRLVPVGVPGEIHVGGEGLARNYLGRPDLTADRFVPDPFSGLTGSRLYRTGDLARFLPEGEIEYLGRIDNQVKIRGFRIELGEIESVLARHPSVAQAVVVFLRNPEGQGEIVAYVVPGKSDSWSESALRDFLRSQLAGHMIPAWVVRLETLPLTANGKLDRRALPDPRLTHGTREFVEPRSPTEHELAGVWAEVLRRDRVGITDNYFELGGDSIKAIQIVSRALRKGIQIKIPDLFRHPTIAELSARASRLQPASQSPASVSDAFGLGPIQSWFVSEYQGHLQQFNQALLLESSDPIGLDVLRISVAAILERHPALGFRFRREGSEWFQSTHHFPVESVFSFIDVSRDPAPEQVVSRHSGDLQTKFDISAGPLFKVVCFLGGQKQWLLLLAHHLVVDGISWRILLEDLFLGCSEAGNGRRPQLPQASASYGAWVRNLGNWVASSESQSVVDYWTQFAGRAPALRTGLEPGPHGGEVEHTMELAPPVPAATWLAEANRTFSTQTEDLIFAALSRAILAGLGLESLVAMTEGHGRDALGDGLDLTRTVGWFTSLYPVLVQADSSKELGRLVKQTKEQLRAIPHQGVSYGALRYMSPPGSAAAALKNIRAMLCVNFLGDFDAPLASERWAISGLPLGPMVAPESPRAFPLTLGGFISAGKLRFSIQYNPSHFEARKIQEFGELFLSSLREVVDHCRGRVVQEVTPSDLTYSQIGLDELEALFRD